MLYPAPNVYIGLATTAAAEQAESALVEMINWLKPTPLTGELVAMIEDHSYVGFVENRRILNALDSCEQNADVINSNYVAKAKSLLAHARSERKAAIYAARTLVRPA